MFLEVEVKKMSEYRTDEQGILSAKQDISRAMFLVSPSGDGVKKAPLEKGAGMHMRKII